MPDVTPTAAAAPSAPPVPPSSPPQGGGPPMGSSPATGPTANRGLQMAGLQRLGVLVNQLSALVPLLGATSKEGQDVLSALQRLAKLVPPGSVTPAAEKNQIENMAMKNQQNASQMKALASQQGQGQPPPPAMGAAA